MKTEADKIARKLIKEYALDDDFVCLDDYRYLFKKAMKEYHHSKLQALKEELEPALKKALIENYKKGNDGKRRNCLGSIESNVEKMFDGLDLDNLITNLEVKN